MQRLVEIVRKQAEATDTPALRDTLVRWEQSTEVVEISPRDTARSKLARELAQGHTYSPEDALRLELEAQQRAFTHRHELLRGALTATQVAALLGATRQTAHDRLRSGTLLAIEDQGRWKFPYWQFDPNGPHGVIAGLPEVLKALEVSDLGKVSWLTRPNAVLENRTPLKALQDGDVARVADQARAVGAC